MNNTVDLLAQLRDIHEPSQPGFWPPAPGWWLLAIVALAILIYTARWLRKKYLAAKPRKHALSELERILISADANPAAEFSTLLKKAALHRYDRAKVAGLAGMDWLNFLDTTGGGGEFSEGTGKILLHAPYQYSHTKQGNADKQALGDLVRKWLVTNL